MLIHLDSRLRGAAALVATGVYLAPAAVGLLAELDHVAYHVHEAIEAQEQKAAAFGLGHLDEQSHRASFEAEGHHEFVHTHDGVTHHHSEGVDALLAASGHADTEIGTASTTSMEIATHLPSAGLAEPPIAPAYLANERRSVRIHSHTGPRPPLPPPRA